ncbi:MAG: peptidoglycan DD-metalloendopeptidase family protein [Flavobacteriales bacterium]|nr:peptidoglycan DD-metalloendopeptidase family protein [Flavobacteriales bacterium]
MNEKMQHVSRIALLLVASFLLCPTAFAILTTDGNKEKADSLVSVEVPKDSVIGESRAFQAMDFMTKSEVYVMIDSLLDLDVIPKELIREIQLVVRSKYAKIVKAELAAAEKRRPATQYYGKWDTYNTHPYPESLSRNDTSVELVLTQPGESYVPPVIGVITSNFGDGRNHSGMDIDLQVWDTVVSAFSGVVRIARTHGGYGRVVVVRHYNGLETLYAHLHRLKVKPGQKVKAGELVGLGGSSGHSSGSHLHFEARFKGKPLNPRNFIDYRNNVLVNDTVILNKTKWSYSVVPKGLKYHRVNKGEFLYLISKQYGISINRLCELNGITRNSILRVGQKLRIS